MVFLSNVVMRRRILVANGSSGLRRSDARARAKPGDRFGIRRLASTVEHELVLAMSTEDVSRTIGNGLAALTRTTRLRSP